MLGTGSRGHSAWIEVELEVDIELEMVLTANSELNILKTKRAMRWLDILNDVEIDV